MFLSSFKTMHCKHQSKRIPASEPQLNLSTEAERRATNVPWVRLER
jgi:hypothetical protein